MLPSLLSSPSPMTVRVEKATSHLLIAPDWTMNMDICDSINTDPLQAKDVVKAVKKRLQNKNPRVQFLALTLLETMIKNCGDFVHFQVVDREVLHDMVKIVRKSTDMQVRDKILVLLDSWQEAFGGPGGKYPQYYHAYAELKTSGIMFPQHQKDAALIYTPVSHNLPPQIGHAIPSSSIQRQDEVMNSEMGNLSLSDLKNIRSVTELFIDMLMAVNPESRQAVNDEIIVDLANQCRMNQKKVMHLISSTENEELLGEALVLNDNLQYALARHDAIASGSPLPLEPPHASLSTSSVVTPTLTHQQLDDQEVEEDDGNRDAKLKSTGDHLASSNQSDLNTATSPSGASEASSSVASNALVLLDPPTPGSASRKEDDMIDFLGLVLSTNPPPQTPPASVPPSNHSQNPFSDAPNPQQQVSSSQPVMVNQGYAANNSYVAPWAQPAVAPLPAPPPSIPPQQPVGQYPYNYQASPWNPSPGVSSNPFLPNSSVQFPAFPSPPPPPPPPPARPFQYPIYQSSTSASVASIKSPPPPVPEPIQYSKAIQNYNPLGSGQAQWNANNSNQTGSSSSSTTKSYFMPDKLFEDLIELRNPDGTLKSRNASTLLGPSGQGMARERK